MSLHTYHLSCYNEEKDDEIILVFYATSWFEARKFADSVNDIVSNEYKKGDIIFIGSNYEPDPNVRYIEVNEYKGDLK